MFDPVLNTAITIAVIMFTTYTVGLMIAMKKYKPRTHNPTNESCKLQNKVCKEVVKSKNVIVLDTNLPTLVKFFNTVKQNVHLILFSVIISSVLVCLISLSNIRISHLPTEQFWIWENIPLSYWLGLGGIVISQFFMIPFLHRKYCKWLFVLSSGLFMICVRVIFTIAMGKPFVPDTQWYMEAVQYWVNHGIYSYQWWGSIDYPVSYAIGYLFVKLGMPINSFFLLAPFFVHVIQTFLIFLIGSEVSNNTKVGCLSTLLWALTSFSFYLGVWHYSPEMAGTIFYLLCLYLCIRFSNRQQWNKKTLIFTCMVIIFLVLSHHLSILYFVFTIVGLCIAQKFFNLFYKKALLYLAFIAFYTMSVWNAWMTLVDADRASQWLKALQNAIYGTPTPEYTSGALPEFFALDLYNKILFLVYPAFILGLAVLAFVRYRNADTLVRKLSFAAIGLNSFMIVIFVFGSVTGVMEPVRMLELLLLGTYPLSAKSFLTIGNFNSFKKRSLILGLVIIFVAFMGIHRLYWNLARCELLWESLGVQV